MKNWKYIDGAKVGNEKAISSTFHINDYGVEVGQWSWDWRGKTPDENKKKEIEQKIKSYVQQINKNVSAGDNDERDAVFSQLDKFVRAQGLNKMAKYTSKADSKKEFLYDEETGDLEVWYDGKKVDSLKKAGEGWKKYIETHATKTGNAESFDEFVKKLAKEKPELYQSLWNAGQMEALKSYYHKITGNDTPAEYFSKKPKVIGNEKTGAEGFFKKLSNDVKEREKEDDEEIKLVGNETYQHKLYPDKYVIIEGKKYKIVTDGKVEKSGELTDAVLYGINQTYKRVGNVASEYEILKQDPSKMHPLYKKAYEEAMKKLARENEDFKKRFEKEYGVKAKNSEADDKFAYVMREFDEGKLKTPDGKVVTDPEQAKAIAYSESKKTENGLARARNAIKKS